MSDLELRPQHTANRLDGVDVLGFDGQVLRLRSSRVGEAMLVMHASSPVTIASIHGAEAELHEGWDGTLGYSHYGLRLTLAGAGEVTVEFRIEPPPARPIAVPEERIDRFIRDLHARPSRFGDDPKQFGAWQRQYRQILAAVLMNGSMPRRVASEVRIIEEKDYPEFTLRRFEYRSQPDRTNTALLSLPKGVKKAPLLLTLHGHEAGWGEADEGAWKAGHNDDFIGYFAERKWAVLQPATMNHTLQHAGWTLQGEWTWDAMVALDVALAEGCVDAGRVAVCGLSTGAHLTMNVLALDERVRAGVVGCVLTPWASYDRFRLPPGCDCGIRSQLATHLETCDWAALAAPKPVQFQHGRQDQAFCPGADESLLATPDRLVWNTAVMPVRQWEAFFAEVLRAWRVAGNPQGTGLVMHDGPHQVDNDAAYEWLTRHVGS